MRPRILRRTFLNQLGLAALSAGVARGISAPAHTLPSDGAGALPEELRQALTSREGRVREAAHHLWKSATWASLDGAGRGALANLFAVDGFAAAPSVAALAQSPGFLTTPDHEGTSLLQELTGLRQRPMNRAFRDPEEMRARLLATLLIDLAQPDRLGDRRGDTKWCVLVCVQHARLQQRPVEVVRDLASLVGRKGHLTLLDGSKVPLKTLLRDGQPIVDRGELAGSWDLLLGDAYLARLHLDPLSHGGLGSKDFARLATLMLGTPYVSVPFSAKQPTALWALVQQLGGGPERPTVFGGISLPGLPIGHALQVERVEPKRVGLWNALGRGGAVGLGGMRLSVFQDWDSDRHRVVAEKSAFSERFTNLIVPLPDPIPPQFHELLDQRRHRR